jgi:hypothetical protein
MSHKDIMEYSCHTRYGLYASVYMKEKQTSLLLLLTHNQTQS